MAGPPAAGARRIPTVVLIGLVAAAGSSLSGCAGRSGGPETTAEKIAAVDEGHTAIVMENVHWRPVHAYLVRDGRPLYDALIGSNETRVAGVRSSRLSDGQVGFRLEVVGSDERYWTTGTIVPLGAEFHLMVESPLRLSYTFLR